MSLTGRLNDLLVIEAEGGPSGLETEGLNLQNDGSNNMQAQLALDSDVYAPKGKVIEMPAVGRQGMLRHLRDDVHPEPKTIHDDIDTTIEMPRYIGDSDMSKTDSGEYVQVRDPKAGETFELGQSGKVALYTEAKTEKVFNPIGNLIETAALGNIVSRARQFIDMFEGGKLADGSYSAVSKWYVMHRTLIGEVSKSSTSFDVNTAKKNELLTELSVLSLMLEA